MEQEAGKSTDRRLTYEEAVDTAGFGLFHWLLLLVCGWANTIEGVESMCVSFLLPTARCDLQLTSSDMGLLTASIFLGMMFGGYIWGYFADQRGRRKALAVSLIVNGLFGAVSSMAPWFWLFLLLRFISGMGVGGSVPIIFSYFCEFMPCQKRGAMVSALATFWMTGNIIAAGVAWVVIPNTWIHYSIGEMDFQSWRVFVVLCSVPSLTSAAMFSTFMPESPKFLMEAGQESEAVRVFQMIFKMNMGKAKRAIPDFRLKVGSGHKSEQQEGKSHTSCVKRLISVLEMGFLPIREMFSRMLRTRSIVILMVFFNISFCFFGLWMWFPEIFKRMEGDNPSCSNFTIQTIHVNHTCYPVKTAVYMEGLILAVSNVPFNFLSILVIAKLGGKILLCSSMVVSGLCVLFILLVHTKVHSLLFSCFFGSMSVISWNALNVLSTELYPTKLRSSAFGFFTGIGRIGSITGNIAFGELLDLNCALPITLVSIMLMVTGLGAIILPQTKRTELT